MSPHPPPTSIVARQRTFDRVRSATYKQLAIYPRPHPPVSLKCKEGYDTAAVRAALHPDVEENGLRVLVLRRVDIHRVVFPHDAVGVVDVPEDVNLFAVG